MGTRLDNAYDELLDQFRDSEAILSFLEVIFNRMEDTDALIIALLENRWLDTAEGVWLDICGKILGLSRPAEFIPDDNIFTFLGDSGDPSDPDKSFGDANPANYGGYFQSLYGVHYPEASLLNDDNYRLLLRAKAASMNASGSLPSIGRFISESFGIDFTFEVPVPRFIKITLDTTDPMIRYAVRTFAPLDGIDDLLVE